MNKQVAASELAPNIEYYIRTPEYDAEKEELASELSIVMRRIDINFDNTQCKLLTFSDLTIY